MRAVIVGAGIMGAACARSLAHAGLEVTVLERSAAAGGTSARCEGNILVSDKTPGPELDLAIEAVRRWPLIAAELVEELGPGFPPVEFEPKGGVVVATTDAGAMSLGTFAVGQRSVGVDAQPIDALQARELEPWLNPDVTAAVHYPQDAQVQPVAAAEALLASARRAGARVLTGEVVTGALEGPHGAIAGVRTGRGVHQGDVVINAAGPWAGEVANALGVQLPVLPRRGVVLVTTRMPHRIFHKVYDADYVGATQSGDATLQTSTVVESTAAGTVLIGSSRQRVGFDDRLDVHVISELAAKAMRIFPFLSDMNLLRSYGGFRPYVPDHLPVIGEDPRRPGLFHVTGHEGAGIGLSVPSADLLLAIMTGSPAATGLRAADFAVDRPALKPHLKEGPT